MKYRLSDDKRGQIKSELLAGGCDSASVDFVVAKIADIIENKKPPSRRGRKPISNKQLADVLEDIENAQQRNLRLTSHSSLANELHVNRKKISRAMNCREAAQIVWCRKRFQLLNPHKVFRPVRPVKKRISFAAKMRAYNMLRDSLWD